MTVRSYGWPESRIDGPPVWTDQSFADFLSRHPPLATMARYLPAAGAAPVFDGLQRLNQLESSYVRRGYGALLYALARALGPEIAVEIGIFQGFSLLSVAAALRDNGAGSITGYDLFDAYPYRHATREQVVRHVEETALAPWVRIDAADVFDVHHQWAVVDFLHVDVSNTGDTYRRIFEQWSEKVRGVIVLEGGSDERDNVSWMRDYDMPPIVPAVEELRRNYPEWSVTVLPPFPSMTIACHRAGLAARSRA